MKRSGLLPTVSISCQALLVKPAPVDGENEKREQHGGTYDLVNIGRFEAVPQPAPLIGGSRRTQVRSRLIITSTTLGSFLLDEGIEFLGPVPLSPFFTQHFRAERRVEQAVMDGCNLGIPRPKRGSWTSSLTTESRLGLLDHLDISRFAAAVLQDPDAYHGQKIGLVTGEMPVKQATDLLAEAIDDGPCIRAVFMTDEEVARQLLQGMYKPTWTLWHSLLCIQY
ncbi:NAD dependent epimerase/dehydratase [Apiospora kogelbergensis]|uniref:NAD dependent epimerase/dehydratase n=1 Tax=Apiospora kogelbergensis TaxID=1337665 RepID=UPI00312CE1B6